MFLWLLEFLVLLSDCSRYLSNKLATNNWIKGSETTYFSKYKVFPFWGVSVFRVISLQPFWRLLDTNRKTNKQQAKCIYVETNFCYFAIKILYLHFSIFLVKLHFYNFLQSGHLRQTLIVIYPADTSLNFSIFRKYLFVPCFFFLNDLSANYFLVQ